MGKQCDNSSCENCENWNKKYIVPNKEFHYCSHLERFTCGLFYCSNHESHEELLVRLDDNKFDDEYC